MNFKKYASKILKWDIKKRNLYIGKEKQENSTEKDDIMPYHMPVV